MLERCIVTSLSRNQVDVDPAKILKIYPLMLSGLIAINIFSQLYTLIHVIG